MTGCIFTEQTVPAASQAVIKLFAEIANENTPGE